MSLNNSENGSFSSEPSIIGFQNIYADITSTNSGALTPAFPSTGSLIEQERNYEERISNVEPAPIRKSFLLADNGRLRSRSMEAIIHTPLERAQSAHISSLVVEHEMRDEHAGSTDAVSPSSHGNLFTKKPSLQVRHHSMDELLDVIQEETLHDTHRPTPAIKIKRENSAADLVLGGWSKVKKKISAANVFFKRENSLENINLEPQGSASKFSSKLFGMRHDSSENIQVDTRASSFVFGRKKQPAASTSGTPKRQSQFWAGMRKAVLSGKNFIIKPTGRVQEFIDENARTKNDLVKYGLFHPLKTWKLRWNMFFGLMVVLSTGYIPYRLAFPDGVDLTFDITFESLCVSVFCIDILLHFNTARFDEIRSILVVDRTVLALHYLKFWFWIDLLTSFPFDLIALAAGASSAALTILPLFRILRFLKLFKVFRMQGYFSNSRYFSLFMIFFELTFIAHTISCFWYYFGATEDAINPEGFPSTWIAAFTTSSYSILDKYVISIYWTLYTMLGIGLGDIHPVNSSERVFAIFVALIGAVFLGVILSQVDNLVTASNARTIKRDEKMGEFLAYLGECKKMSRSLQIKAIDAYSYYLDKKSDLDIAGSLNGIPHLLLSNLITCVYGSTIKRINFLQKVSILTDRDFIVGFLVEGKPFRGIPGEELYKIGDISNEVTFILRGAVQISTLQEFDYIDPNASMSGEAEKTLVNTEKIIEGYASQEYYFGDFEFHKKLTRIANYTAFTHSEFFSISYSALEKLIAKFDTAGVLLINEMRNRVIAYEKTTQKGLEKLEGRPGFSRKKIWVDGHARAHTYIVDVDNGSTSTLSYSVISSIEVDPSDKEGNVKIDVTETTSSALFQKYIIYPESRWKIAWDLFITLLIFYVVFAVTIQVSFGVDPVGVWDGIDILVTAAFIADIFITFLTACKHEDYNAYVAIHSYIAKTYMRRWLLIDVVSSLPFERMFPSTETNQIQLLKFLRMTRLVRLLRLLKLGDLFAVFSSKFHLNPIFVKGGSLFILIILACHFIACFWWFMSINLSNSESWIDNSSMTYSTRTREGPLAEKYILALYFSYITLLGVGYGDITPQNTGERLVDSLIMLCASTLLLNYVLAGVAEIVHKIFNSRAHIENQLITTKEYLKEKRVPKSLSASIVKFMEVRNQLKVISDEKSLVGELPSHLREEILFVQHIKVLKKIPIFKYISNRSMTIYIFNLLHVTYYDKNEYIFHAGEASSDFKFLVAGEAQLFQKIAAPPKNDRDFRTARQKYAMQTTRVHSTKTLGEDVIDGRRRLSEISLILSTAAVRIEHRAPDATTHYFVKSVLPGDIFEASYLRMKQPHKYTAWTTVQTCIYSLSNDSLDQFMKDFPSAAMDLQSAFVAVLREQTSKTRRAKAISKITKYNDDVSQLYVPRPRRMSINLNFAHMIQSFDAHHGTPLPVGQRPNASRSAGAEPSEEVLLGDDGDWGNQPSFRRVSSQNRGTTPFWSRTGAVADTGTNIDAAPRWTAPGLNGSIDPENLFRWSKVVRRRRSRSVAVAPPAFLSPQAYQPAPSEDDDDLMALPKRVAARRGASDPDLLAKKGRTVQVAMRQRSGSFPFKIAMKKNPHS